MTETIRETDAGRLAFLCPGCGLEHEVNTYPDVPGTCLIFNQRWDRPGFSRPISGAEGCRAMVRAGRIHFDADCTHSLAGQTVDLPPIGRGA